MKIIKLRSLLPEGEGQDEGIYKNSNLAILDSLTPTLSRREREFVGQHWPPVFVVTELYSLLNIMRLNPIL